MCVGLEMLDSLGPQLESCNCTVCAGAYWNRYVCWTARNPVAGPQPDSPRSLAFCILGIVYQIDPNSGLATSHFNKFAKFSMIYFVLSLCSTAICTLAIIYRILAVSKESGFSLIGPYRKVLEIIVESAALYTVALVVYLPLLVRADFSDGYPQALLISITVSVPTCLG